MRTLTLSVLLACAALAAGCGGSDDDDGGAEAPTQPAPAAETETEEVDLDPYAIKCSEIDDISLTRQTTTALAEENPVEGLTPLRVSQSLFFAMTEICKDKRGSYEPARDAVEGVRDGTYRVEPPATEDPD